MQLNCLSGKLKRYNYILSASKVAILVAINAYQMKSKLVLRCFKVVKTMSRTNKVTLMWVSDHSWIIPKTFSGPIHELLNLEQQELWHVSEGCRQAKLFKPSLSTKLNAQVVNLNWKQISKAIGFLTGHCQIKGHLYKLGIVSNFYSICSEFEDLGHVKPRLAEFLRKVSEALGNI